MPLKAESSLALRNTPTTTHLSHMASPEGSVRHVAASEWRKKAPKNTNLVSDNMAHYPLRVRHISVRRLITRILTPTLEVTKDGRHEYP